MPSRRRQGRGGCHPERSSHERDAGNTELGTPRLWPKLRKKREILRGRKERRMRGIRPTPICCHEVVYRGAAVRCENRGSAVAVDTYEISRSFLVPGGGRSDDGTFAPTLSPVPCGI